MAETTVKAIQWGVIIGASLIASVIDVRTRRIPNTLCGPLFLSGLIWSFGHYGFKGLAEALAAAVILALPFVLLFIFGGGGAGDAKLTGAVGAWLGIHESFIALACICIAGGILALVIAIYKRKLKIVLMNTLFLIFDIARAIMTRRRMIRRDETAPKELLEKLTIPYGVAILTGLCAAGGIIWMR